MLPLSCKQKFLSQRHCAITEREVQSKFVALGVSILQAQPTEANINLRKWATEILNKYSGVPIDDATKKDLIEQIPLPSGSITPERSPIRLFCTCRAKQTFCFRNKEECEAINSNNKCEIRYSSKHAFNVLYDSKWSKYEEGWVIDNCVL
jgi:hypothetical protein